ncbi:MAG TPA: dTDP-4-dehydrorhamnose reductase [Chlamydiales bacterium]|jgi:dTDP-4-dehydrorhamnose reductase
MMLWITGAKGLVGSALAAKISGSVVSGREVDIADRAACRAFLKKHPAVTHIVNCAAFSAVDPAETLRDEAYRANALGPEVLGLCAQEAGLRLLHLSTDYVFPGTGNRPLKETDPVKPCNFYGETKLEGEQRLFSVMPTACVLRTSWIFGSGGKNFVAKLFDLLATKEKLSLVSDQTGRPTYAPDLVEVILKLLDQSGLYQFANAGATSKYEFALELQKEMNDFRCKIEPVPGSTFPSPAKRPLYSAFDTTKIEQLLHFTPRHWKTCLKEYIHAQSL